jgi:hypothetical protein
MEVLYNILNEFSIPMKLEKLIKMCLNEAYISFLLRTVETRCFTVFTLQLCFRLRH